MISGLRYNFFPFIKPFPNFRNFAWQQGYGACSVRIRRFRKRSIEQQLEYHRTRTFREEYLALRNTAPISTRNNSGISYARSYRTLRDGSFEGRFPRHFVPGYDRCCPYGTRWQTFRNRLTTYRVDARSGERRVSAPRPNAPPRKVSQAREARIGIE